MRYVIVNADDFGSSEGINRGIIEAHETGIVTSASLMVNAPATEAAVELARDHQARSPVPTLLQRQANPQGRPVAQRYRRYIPNR